MIRDRTADDRQVLIDRHRREEEIAMLTRLMIEATARPGPLSQDEIDHLLGHRRTVVPVQHAHPDE